MTDTLLKSENRCATIDQDMKILLDWLTKNLPVLRASGDNWQLILHGGADGRVAREVKLTGELLPSKRR